MLGNYQLQRFLGDMRIGSQHDRDRFAHVTHLVDGQDGLVVKRRSVVGIRNNLDDVVSGNDAVDSFLRAGCTHVYLPDAPVRYRAAEDFPVQHPGDSQVMDILGAPRNLCASFEAPDRSANLLVVHGIRGHLNVAPLTADVATAEQVSPGMSTRTSRSSCRSQEHTR